MKSIPTDDFNHFWPDTRTRTDLPEGQKNYSVKLPFEITFYSHPVKELFIFPEGFVSVGDTRDHDSRYIAPLPIAFECHHSDSSSLSYWLADKNQSISVQWENCIPKNIPMKAPFTFRLKVWRKGLIEFTYKKLGISIQAGILDFMDGIFIGISDSITTGNFTYKYHEVRVPQKYIAENVRVSIRPLPGSCIEMDSCEKCVTAFRADHHCYWCPDISKCLSGMDFHKPDYQSARCNTAKEKTDCKMKKFLPFVETTTPVTTTTLKPKYDDVIFHSKTKYYNATLLTDPEKVEALWVNMSDSSKILTGSSDWIKLPFSFPFFGDRKTHFKMTLIPGQIRFAHSTYNVALNILAPGIYLWPIHHWGEFFTKVQESFDRVTIQWTLTSFTKDGPPCYQATLFSDGNINFVYRKIPSSRTRYRGQNPLMMGLIYKWFDSNLSFNVAHAVAAGQIRDLTAIMWTAAPGCGLLTSCSSCVARPGCRWCPAADLCTDTNTLDPDWEVRMCDHNHLAGDTAPKLCPVDAKFELNGKELQHFKRKDGKMYYRIEVENEGVKNEPIYQKYFLNFSNLPADKVIVEDPFQLQKHHTLPFIFPFFGHPIQNIDISAHGYIHIPDQNQRKRKSEMQYIAPYWIDGDSELGATSISVYEHESSITISWIYSDNFEFQLFLDYTGKIVFIYQKKAKYPFSGLTIGLSDSFFYKDPDKPTQFREYNYHALNLSTVVSRLGQRSGLVLSPLATCNTASTCADCTTMDPAWGCVWCPALEMCSNGVDRRRLEWDEETCYLEHTGVRHISTCPMEQTESKEKFYEVSVSHVDGEKLADYFTVAHRVEIKHHRPVHWTLPFSFPFFEEQIHVLALNEGGLISPRAEIETKNKVDATYTFIQLTQIEEELKVSRGSGFYKESKCEIIVFDYDERMTDQIKLIICSDGSINVFYSVPQNHFLDDTLLLSHGIYDPSDNILDHALAHLHLDPDTAHSQLGAASTLVTFTPVTRCSLSRSCLSSAHCPAYSGRHHCRRFSCEPGPHSEEEDCHLRPEDTHTQGPVLAVLGAGLGLLLVFLVAGVLLYNLRRLDTPRRAWDSLTWRWLGLGYSAFSGAGDEDRRRVAEAEEDGNTEEISL